MQKLELKSTDKKTLMEVKLALDHLDEIAPHQCNIVCEYLLLLHDDLEKMNKLLIEILQER